MSLILKGIDLPRERETLKLVIFPQGAVVRHKEDEIWETGEEYQAIQIPKEHGKIVDLDDLVVKYWDGNYMEIDNEAYDNAIVILEEEERNG